MKLGVFIQKIYKDSLSELIRALFTDDEYVLVEDLKEMEKFNERLDIDIDNQNISVTLTIGEQKYSKTLNISKRFSEIILKERSSINFYVKKLCYEHITKYYGRVSPWGILTGVRPVKLVHKMKSENWTDDRVIDELCQKFLVSIENAELISDIANRELKIINDSRGKASLYISIPFCPSKCVYCSFPTHVYNKWKHLEQEYIDALCNEIERFSKYIKEPIHTIYIGGGTPSSITRKSIKQMLEAIENNVNLSNVIEFTYEAGRPDTIDEELLVMLKKYGVTRLSINPQTFNDEILKKMGRTHSAKDIVGAYNLARKYDFDINMDLILGLPDEDAESYRITLEKIVDLSPENVTIHSLAIKRAAELKHFISKYSFMESKTIEKLVEESLDLLSREGYSPYYLYRQQHISENLANIGYAKEHKLGIYNILMMEEVHPIYSFGVGGVSKIFESEKNKFKSVPNFRDIVPYLERFEEMLEKKIEILTNN